MYLKDLAGKRAIRTAKPDVICPWDTGALRKAFSIQLPPFSTMQFDEKTKYMDAPVKIIAVKEEQVVIEDCGKRKILERKFIDEHWTDYEKLLHPEKEEQEKLENMSKEIKAAAEPLRRFLEKYYDPMVKVVVETDRVVVERGEFQEIFQEEEETEENE